MNSIHKMGDENPLVPTKAGAGEKTITHIKTIRAGREVSRLQLNKNDPTFNVAAKTFKKGNSFLRALSFHHNRYVAIKNGETRIELNVRSAAKRLGISQKELRTIVKEANKQEGENAIKTLQNRAKLRKAVLERYEEKIQNYAEKSGKLKTTQDGIKTGLRPKTLLKVIEKGLEIKQDEISFTSGKKEIDGKSFHYLAKDNEQEILHDLSKISNGAFGQVFKTLVLTEARVEARKEAIGKTSERMERAVEDLKNEFNVLKAINGEKQEGIEGIQSTPHFVTNIEGNNNGYLRTELMDGDLTDLTKNAAFQRLPVGERLELCRQLLNGLTAVHEKGYAHRDIKLGNCLYKIKKNEAGEMEIKLVIADFGLATSEDPMKTAGTRPYIPRDENKNATLDDCKKIDVFAMSRTLIELLGVDNRHIEDAFVDTQGAQQSGFAETIPIDQTTKNDRKTKVKEVLRGCGIPEAITEVLLSGVAPKEARVSAEDLLKNFNDAIENFRTNDQKSFNSTDNPLFEVMRTSSLLGF